MRDWLAAKTWSVGYDSFSAIPRSALHPMMLAAGGKSFRAVVGFFLQSSDLELFDEVLLKQKTARLEFR